MGRVKRVTVLYDDGNTKEYNLNSFLKVFGYKLKEYLSQRGI